MEFFRKFIRIGILTRPLFPKYNEIGSNVLWTCPALSRISSGGTRWAMVRRKNIKNPEKRVCTHNSAKSGRIKEGWLREADKYAIYVGDDSTSDFLFASHASPTKYLMHVPPC